MDWLDEATKPVYDQLTRMGRSKLASMYRNCFRSTWDTTLQRSDGTVFLVTGDIPAMWLRDSSAQVYHYVPHAGKYPEVRRAILGLMERQFQYIVLDPYANAFNREANDRRNHLDDTSWTEEARLWIWERKYEVDSLCYPIRLAHHFWKTTGDASWCNDTFLRAAEQILTVWETEQRHMEQSPYHFSRVCRRPTDTLGNGGKGAPVAYTGMTWSGFRPSDDACTYGYLIPSNFFAAKSLAQMEEMLNALRPEA
ncbi:MAG: glycoside hydrolase family 125 protein, partial [Clostridia bacterium]|nr:glycoside hydrolase family 125 protein [Clostridia bacterium]